MHIIVCIKQVPDPEGDREAFEILDEPRAVKPRGIPPVLGLFDENALEAALCIKDASTAPVSITVLSMGKRVADAVMTKTLAAGADQIVKVEDDLFDSAGIDSLGTAQMLARTVQKIGPFDLILTGRQSSDLNAGQTGIYLGLHLDIPVISLVQKIDASPGQVRAERLIPGGYEVVQVDLPAVAVVSNEVGELRYPAMKARREARKKPILGMTLEDFGLNESTVPDKLPLVLQGFTHPAMPEKKCHYFPADDPVRAGKHLVNILLDDHILETLLKILDHNKTGPFGPGSSRTSHCQTGFDLTDDQGAC